MSLRTLSKLLVAISIFFCAPIFAAPLVVNVAGVKSMAELGNAANTVLTFNVGANATISSIAYNVNVTAYNPSYLSELALYFGDTDQATGVYFTPGFADSQPGTASYADSADLVALGLDFAVGADGILRLEFFEDFDDASVAPDGVWNFGTITFGVTAAPGSAVPEPASLALLGLGLAGIAAARRRLTA